MTKMKFCFDIDGTICTLEFPKPYTCAKPFLNRIKLINKLFDEGHTIIFYTARGVETHMDWKIETRKQLKKWGVKYHRLIMNKKPHADLFIDDKGINANEFFK